MQRLIHTACFLVLALCIYSCTPIDLYEKSIAIPQHQWKSDFHPSFDFVIKDSSSAYKIFLVLRHTEKYNFNNIYVNLYIKGPGQDTAVKIQKDLRLATNEGGWEGSGMDDVYEHRIPLSQGQTLKAGSYNFTIEQIMREDPLQHVLNVGLRLEK
jgi:gliding motility-associated lipoprotein GldH